MRQATNVTRRVSAEASAERKATAQYVEASERAARAEERARGYGRKPEGRPVADTRAVARAGRYVMSQRYVMSALRDRTGRAIADTLPATFDGATYRVPVALAERWADGLLLAAGYDTNASDTRHDTPRALAPATRRAVALVSCVDARQERARAARAAWCRAARETVTHTRSDARRERERERDRARRERERALREVRAFDRAHPPLSAFARVTPG